MTQYLKIAPGIIRLYPRTAPRLMKVAGYVISHYDGFGKLISV